jgi:hypothetical protein
LESDPDPDPVRVRAAWACDTDIRAMTASIDREPDGLTEVLAIEAGAAA